MTLYFFDDITRTLIAVDTDTNAARLIPEVKLAPDAIPLQRPSDQTRRTAAPKPAKTPPGRKASACSICSKPGHNAKTCPKKNGSLPADEQRSEAMSRMNFGKVKIAQSHDISASVIATQLGVPRIEVERALQFQSYNDYAAV